MTKIADHTKLLHKEQRKSDTPEDIARLPRLTINDIVAPPTQPHPQRITATLPCYLSEIPTHRIGYVHIYANIACIPWDDLPYVSILSLLLGKLNTAHYTAPELDTYVESNLENLSFSIKTYKIENNPDEARVYLAISTSALSELVSKTANILGEIWGTTRFDDIDRIRNILTQQRIALEQGFVNSGHTATRSRLASYGNAAAHILEHTCGIDFYQFLKELLDIFDACKADLQIKLASLLSRIFTTDNVEVSFAGTAEDPERFWQGATVLNLDDNSLSSKTPEKHLFFASLMHLTPTKRLL